MQGYFCMTLENGLLKLLADNVISYMVSRYLKGNPRISCELWGRLKH